MLVVVAIIAVVSSVLLFNYSNFSTNVSVRNLTQEIALSVRKSQTYATSVRTLDSTNLSSKTFPGFGIAFSAYGNAAAGPTVPSPSQFVLFADTNVTPGNSGAGVYDDNGVCGNPMPGSECVEVFTINSADRITQICTGPSGTAPCYDSTNNATLYATFRRPSPDAVLCMKVNGILDCSIGSATLELKSAKNLIRHVQIFNTGQISVQ